LGRAPLLSTPTLLLLGRIVLLGAAAGAVGLAMALARGHDRAVTRSSARYVCPMHPEVTARAPGDCPICGMALERVRDAPPPAQASATGAPILADVQRRVLGAPLRAPAWLSAPGEVTALLHQDDLVDMTPGDRALFFAGTAPAVGVAVHLTAEPSVAVDASTCQVRFAVAGGALAQAPPAAGLLQLAAHPRALLTVPASAVLYSNDGPYVLTAAPASDSFAKRAVAIGRILDSSYAAGVTGDNVGAIVILSGLREGERVVAADAFFWDAERRLRLARGEGHEVAP
jgi:hypothetical protein